MSKRLTADPAGLSGKQSSVIEAKEGRVDFGEILAKWEKQRNGASPSLALLDRDEVYGKDDAWH